MSTLADAALAYVRHGWPVFPLRPRSKEPEGRLAPRGFRDATTDADRVRAWWQQCPDANIGVPTGRAIGAWVLDVDCRNGARGLETYERLSVEPALRDTLQQITGSGGKQLFFALPDFNVPCVGRKRAEIVGLQGCDIKGDGGYVVVPPSVHPDTGQEYLWDGLHDFTPQQILAAPPVLLRALAQLIEAPEGGAKTSPIPGIICEGQRNDTLFRMACSLRAKGFSEPAILAALAEENRARCSPPLAHSEIERIAGSAARYTPGGDEKPRSRTLRTDAARTPEQALVLLNALPLWEHRLEWAAFRRRGNTLVGITAAGEEVFLEIPKLTRFAHAQARILEALAICIRGPRRGQIGESWGVAAELMLRAAAADKVDVGRPEDDLRADLRRCWTMAGEPSLSSRKELAEKSWLLKNYRREPHAEQAPPAVFLYDSEAYTYLPVLRQWLSTPAGGNRYLSLPLMREHLALLGFSAREVDTRDLDFGARLNFWCGHAEVIKED